MSTAAAGEVKHRGLIALSAMLATIMQALDTTIANVALPHMQGSLSAAQDQIAWVLTSYIVAAAIATPLTGWLAGRFGRKRLFLIAVGGFTLTSVLCGIATTLEQILLYRLLQGVFGASLVPLSQALMLDINPPEKHGQAMAIWGAGIMVGPILGPTLGGWLTESWNWRWVFYINLPVGVLAFAGIWIFVQETQRDLSRRFDLFGFAMLSLAVGAMQLMLDRGQQLDWFGATEIWIQLGLAIGGFWVFAVHSATARQPFVSLALFRDRNFLTSSLVITVVGMILYTTLALLPPMLQDLLNYPVLAAGTVLASRGVGTLCSMLAVGRLSGKVDSRLLILLGLLLTAGSLWQMTDYNTEMGQWPVFWAGLLQGVGLGFIFVPLSTLAFATLPAASRTEAAGVFSLVRNLGGSVGISIVVSLLARNTQVNHATLAAAANPFNPVFDWPQVKQIWDLGSDAGLAALNGEITAQAAMIAYVNDYKLLMLLSLLTLPLLLLLRKPQRPQKPAVVAD